jgi:hypothetical protein
MYVCMYVCVYVCMYVCMRVCTYSAHTSIIYTHATHTETQQAPVKCIYTHICIYTREHTERTRNICLRSSCHVRIQCALISIYIYIYIYMYMYIYVYINTHTHVHIYVYIHVNIPSAHVTSV